VRITNPTVHTYMYIWAQNQSILCRRNYICLLVKQVCSPSGYKRSECLNDWLHGVEPLQKFSAFYWTQISIIVEFTTDLVMIIPVFILELYVFRTSSVHDWRLAQKQVDDTISLVLRVPF
jgi:hypothetical protein